MRIVLIPQLRRNCENFLGYNIYFTTFRFLRFKISQLSGISGSNQKKKMSRLPLLVLATAVLRALARDIPSNVEDFYNANIVRLSLSSQSPTPPLSLSLYIYITNLSNPQHTYIYSPHLQNPSANTPHQAGTCASPLSDAFTDGQTDTANIVYCSDASTGAVYLKGPDGTYDDMDIDCDGLNASTGLCNNDPSGQSQTAFQSEVQEFGIADLDAHVHPYVVLGNEGADPSFDPQSAGVKPLSVVAVVCNGQLVSLRSRPAFPPFSLE